MASVSGQGAPIQLPIPPTGGLQGKIGDKLFDALGKLPLPPPPKPPRPPELFARFKLDVMGKPGAIITKDTIDACRQLIGKVKNPETKNELLTELNKYEALARGQGALRQPQAKPLPPTPQGRPRPGEVRSPGAKPLPSPPQTPTVKASPVEDYSTETSDDATFEAPTAEAVKKEDFSVPLEYQDDTTFEAPPAKAEKAQTAPPPPAGPPPPLPQRASVSAGGPPPPADAPPPSPLSARVAARPPKDEPPLPGDLGKLERTVVPDEFKEAKKHLLDGARGKAAKEVAYNRFTESYAPTSREGKDTYNKLLMDAAKQLMGDQLQQRLMRKSDNLDAVRSNVVPQAREQGKFRDKNFSHTLLNNIRAGSGVQEADPAEGTKGAEGKQKEKAKFGVIGGWWRALKKRIAG